MDTFGGAVGFWPDTKSRGRGGGGGGGGGGGYGRVSGSPGYSTVVEFMRTDINRQRKLSTQICGPKSYQFINGGGGGASAPSAPPPPPPPPPGSAAAWSSSTQVC